MSKHHSISLLHKNRKRIAFVFLKLFLVFGAGFFIYNKLIHNDTLDFDYFVAQLHANKIITVQNILILLTFSLFNWLFECLKWQCLVSEVKSISYKKAMEQSLGSLTASILTPNRIGEYGAKSIYYAKIYRKKILGLNLIGNLAQLVATTLFGIIGFVYVINQFKVPISYQNILIIGVFGVLILLAFFLFSAKSKFKIKGYSFERLKQFVARLQQRTIVQTLFLSLLRYAIFSHQFYFLIWLFGINSSYLDSLALISSMYLLTSAIPTIFILDVLVKGSVAVWLFSFVGANEFVVLSITTLIWILNFALPSIIGSYYVLNFKMTPKTT